MYYLADATTFILLTLVLFIGSWWHARPELGYLENTLLPGAAFLGVSGLILWLQGSLLGLQLLWWPILAWFFWPNSVPLRERIPLIRQQWQNARHGLSTLRGLDWLLIGYLVVVFIFTFILTLAPPAGNDYDSLVYHLAAPQRYLQAGRIIELPYDHHSYFPFTLEMLFMLGLWLKGPVLAKLFHWLMLPLCCGVLVMWGKRFLTMRAGLTAAALFASLPVVQGTASTAYIDLALAAWVLLAFYSFSRWLEMRAANWLMWCGLFCGFALGTKYLGALTFGFLLAWAIVVLARERKFEVRAVGGMAIIALLVGGGWYVRNWFWTGNPVFPFAYGIFGGEGWTAAMAAAYEVSQREYGFGRGPLDWLLLPWRLSMTPLNLTAVNGLPIGVPFWPLSVESLQNATNNGLFEVPGLVLQTVLGPVLLALSAPLLFVRRKPAVVGLALWAFLFFWLFWAATGQYLRYLIPAFAILCLPCGYAFDLYLQRSAPLKWTSTLALAACLLFAPLLTWQNAESTLRVVLGQITPEQYLSRAFSGYEAMHWASRATPPDARFAIYGEPRNFYLQREYFWADDPHNNLIDYEKVQSGEDLVEALKQLGATHLLWNTQPATNGGFGGPPQPQMNQAIEEGRLQLLVSARGYNVYSIP